MEALAHQLVELQEQILMTHYDNLSDKEAEMDDLRETIKELEEKNKELEEKNKELEQKVSDLIFFDPNELKQKDAELVAKEWEIGELREKINDLERNFIDYEEEEQKKEPEQKEEEEFEEEFEKEFFPFPFAWINRTANKQKYYQVYPDYHKICKDLKELKGYTSQKDLYKKIKDIFYKKKNNADDTHRDFTEMKKLLFDLSQTQTKAKERFTHQITARVTKLENLI